MPLNIRSDEVNALAADLARLKKVSKTEAVRQALVEAIQRENDNVPFLERIKVIQDKIASYPDTGLKADKAFFDELSGDR